MNTNKILGPICAVMYGTYDWDRDLFEWAYDENHVTFVSGAHVRLAIKNLKNGAKWNSCSPVLDISRREAAYLLANGDEILKKMRVWP